MADLFNSSSMQLTPLSQPILREDIYVSVQDAQRAGMRGTEQYCIFGIQPLYPGASDEEFAARVIVSPEVQPGVLAVNQHFLAETGFQPDDERFWFVRSAPATVQIQEIVIEHPLDQASVEKEINDLRHKREELFTKRCLLAGPGKQIKDFVLRTQGRASFYFRAMSPSPVNVGEKTIFIIAETSAISLFIPHRKSGVDMVVVVDGSGSMDIDDFVYDGRRRPRLEGVRTALDLLFQIRLVSGSRISSMAAVAFGRNAKMLFPFDISMQKITDESQLSRMRESIRHVNDTGLSKLGVDRTGTVISTALKLASDLLDLYAQDNNDRIVILLSDGADWQEDSRDRSIGEIVRTSTDPAVLADSMYHDSGIHVHTIAISDEATFLRYFPGQRDQLGSCPNKVLLKKIAEFTDGMFLESPSADQLARIFEELGVGTTYPIN